MSATSKHEIMTALTSQPKWMHVILAIWVAVNVTIVVPRLTDTTATVYGAISLAGFGVLYAWGRVQRHREARRHS